MISIKKKEECNGCHGCFNICPKKCINMKSDEEGFWYPEVDTSKCIDCHLCENVCPILKKAEPKKEIVAYACKNKNDNERLGSSSGGVFILLCKEIINENGIIFGATFDENLNVVHSSADTLLQCEMFKGSKYVQSKIGDNYIKAKQFLDEGRKVLFSGTPCQVAGLQSYLRKDYENLILVDIACHGVPSPKIYKKYIESVEKKANSKLKVIQFRDKTSGWLNYSFKTTFENGNEQIEKGNKNIYMKGFLKDIYLRPSCHECDFKKPKTLADITLADYWGIKWKHPEFFDDKGVSLILVNSKKGAELFNKISNDMEVIDTDYDYAVKCNPSIVVPTPYNPKREEFFYDLKGNNLYKCIKKYTKTPIKKIYEDRIRYNLGRIKKGVVKVRRILLK